MSSLHLLGSGRLLAGAGCWLAAGCWGAGRCWATAKSAKQGRTRKTDRPSNQVLSSHLTAPIQPTEIERMPKLLFHPQSKELAIGDARAETSLASTVARLPEN